MPGLADLRETGTSDLRRNLTAAVTVAAVAVPAGLGMAELAGLPVVTGLYATFLPLAGYALFGSSRQLIIGPEGAVATLTAVAVAPLAAGQPARYAAYAAMLALLIGLVFFVASLLQLGFLADFFSKPVLLGYINGTALTIIVSQIAKMLGLSISAEKFFPSLKEIIEELGEVHRGTVLLSTVLLVFALVLRRYVPKVPAALAVVVVAIVLSEVLDLQERGIAVVGSLQQGLPRPKVPHVGLGGVFDLLLPAVAIALVSFADTIALTRVYASKHGRRINPNRELAGLGGANVLAGLTQAFPVGSSGSRTALNDEAGGSSQIVGLAALVIVAVILVVGTPLIEPLPKAALGVVVTVAALGLFDIRSIWRLRRVRDAEVGLAAAATAGVLAFGVFGGVLVAVGLSIGMFLYRAVRPHDALLGAVDDIDGYHDIERHEGAAVVPGLIVYRFDATLFFPNAEYFRQRVLALTAAADPPAEWFMVNAETFVYVDATAMDALKELRAELASKGVLLAFARVKGRLAEIFTETGFMDELGPENVFPTVRTGVEAYIARRSI
jgi:SulP family sulfate permease